MLKQIYTSNKSITLTGNPASMAMGLVYVAAWDALLLLNGSRLDKVFRDGSQAILGQAPSNLYPGSRVNGRHFWLHVTYPYSGTLYGADEITGQYCLDQILDSAWPIPSALASAGNFIDDWLGIYIINTSGGKVSFYRLTDGTLLGSVQLNSSLAYNSLAYVGCTQVMAFQKATGNVALIDYRNLAILWQSSVPPALLAAYDSLHNLVITIQSDLKMRLFLAAPGTPGLSAPEFFPAPGQVTTQSGYVVRVRLLADDGSPMPGVPVTWNLANPPLGFLQKLLSNTDASGYAWNFYFGPAAATGPDTIQTGVDV